jgi:hypothetical protein
MNIIISYYINVESIDQIRSKIQSFIFYYANAFGHTYTIDVTQSFRVDSSSIRVAFGIYLVTNQSLILVPLIFFICVMVQAPSVCGVSATLITRVMRRDLVQAPSVCGVSATCRYRWVFLTGASQRQLQHSPQN